VNLNHHLLVKDIFNSVCDLAPGERERALDKACAGDSALRAEVLDLLKFDDDSTGDPSNGRREVPTTVGSFGILRRIGAGGMGEVWEAEQHGPLERRVAIKLIKWGMDSEEVVARFGIERQALALMNHPNIARVLEAGTTDDGRPFFAMELVDGVPITAYCDRKRLTTRDRLLLLVQVCEGVQHAHQRGIIHRDLKPSNVLVEEQDGRPIPKIIDFGIAKAIAHRSTEHTVFTQLGQWVGTPEYMSPEQADPTGSDIDTRTDVYSLGVLLYEVLVGAQPFDPEELRAAGFDMMRKVIREVEPPRPSTRVSSLGGDSVQAAEKRQTDPYGLVRLLRGDLDWIVMKAMEKDRNRRYGSAAELADDIDRYLHDQAVEARPPTLSYQLVKLVRRHKVAVASSAIVIIAILAGLAFASVGLVRARRAERTAQAEAEAARAATSVLVDVFAGLDPGGATGQSASAESILDRAAQRVGSELAGQPLIQAQLLHTMGSTATSLGLYERARLFLDEALRLSRLHLGQRHPVVARTLSKSSRLAYQTGDLNLAKLDEEEALEILEANLGESDPALVQHLVNLAWALGRQADFEGAERALTRALELAESGDEAAGIPMADILFVRATMALWRGEWIGARIGLENALEIREPSEEYDTVAMAWLLHHLGWSERETDALDIAKMHDERALSIMKKAFGPSHPALAAPVSGLGSTYVRLGEHEQAREHFETALQLQEFGLGSNHPDVAHTLRSYATLLRRTGELDASRLMLERALLITEDAFGSDHMEVWASVEGLARLEYDAGNLDRSRELWMRAVDISSRVLGPNHQLVGGSHYNLACVLATSEENDRAIAHLRMAVAAGLSHPGMGNDPDLRRLRGNPAFDDIVAEMLDR